MPNYEMRMGHHSEDSDGTFKEKDKNAILDKIYRESGKNNFQPLNVKVQDNIPNFESGKAPRFDHLSNKEPNATLSQSDIDSVLNPPSSTNNTPPATPPASKPKKPWVKKGGKATGKMKDYALYSEARRKEYDARGWTYDDTIKGYNKDGSKKQQRTQSKSTVSAIKPTTYADIKPQISASPISIPTIKPSTSDATTQSKSSKIRAKGEAALESGNVKKAQRLRKRYDRIQTREAKKAQRQQKRQDRKKPVVDIYSPDFPSTFGYDPSKYKIYSSVSNSVSGARFGAQQKAYHDNQTSVWDTKTFKITKGPSKGSYKHYKIYKLNKE